MMGLDADSYAELRTQRLVNQLQISVSNGMEHFHQRYWEEFLCLGGV